MIFVDLPCTFRIIELRMQFHYEFRVYAIKHTHWILPGDLPAEAGPQLTDKPAKIRKLLPPAKPRSLSSQRIPLLLKHLQLAARVLCA